MDHSRSKHTDGLVKEYPTIVTLKNPHNHCFDTAAVLRFRDMSVETRKKLLELFHRGHSPSSSLHCLKMDFMLEYSDKYFEIAADGHYVPSNSIVHKLYEAEFKQQYGSMSGDDMFSDLEKILGDYNEQKSGGCAKFGRCGDQYHVAICSPIMSRAHEKLVQSSELVMVDAAGGIDRQRHRIYFFVTPTAAGGIPLGALITSSEKEEIFHSAISSLKECLPSRSFFNTGCPKVFLTDNDLKERRSLKQQFPAALTMLCIFHVLKAMWSWLCDTKHGIDKCDRQELYFCFKNILYASSETEFQKQAEKFTLSSVHKKYGKFQKYFSSLLKSKLDWALCFRQGLPLRGNNTTNYVEVVFRIL